MCERNMSASLNNCLRKSASRWSKSAKRLLKKIFASQEKSQRPLCKRE